MSAEPSDITVDVLHDKGRYAFSQTHVTGKLGSKINIRFVEDDSLSIFQSSRPPCSKGETMTEYPAGEAIRVDGKPTMTIVPEDSSDLFFFIQSPFHETCSPACCLVFTSYDEVAQGFAGNSGTVSGSALSTTPASSSRPTDLTYLPTGTITQVLGSVSSVAGPTSSGSSRNGSGPILPPIMEAAGHTLAISQWSGFLILLALGVLY